MPDEISIRRDRGVRPMCRPDSSGADWFRCSNGTVGCPRIHGGRTPHCIACASATPCRYQHNPPALEEAALTSSQSTRCVAHVAVVLSVDLLCKVDGQHYCDVCVMSHIPDQRAASEFSHRFREDHCPR